MMVQLWNEADASIPALYSIRYMSFFGLLFALFCLCEKRNPEDTSGRDVDEHALSSSLQSSNNILWVIPLQWLFAGD